MTSVARIDLISDAVKGILSFMTRKQFDLLSEVNRLRQFYSVVSYDEGLEVEIAKRIEKLRPLVREWDIHPSVNSASTKETSELAMGIPSWHQNKVSRCKKVVRLSCALAGERENVPSR